MDASTGTQVISKSFRTHQEMRPALVSRDMRYWVMKPDARLRRHVYCYFLAHPMTSPCGGGVAYKKEELLIPDGHSEIVFNVAGAYERGASGSPGRAIMRHSYLIGGRSHSVLTRDLEPVTVAGVKLDPRCLHRLIGSPLTEFSDTTLSFRDLNHRALLDLEDAVASVAHCPRLVAGVLDEFFLQLLPHMPRVNGRIDALVRHIQSSRGTLSIMQWARDHRIDPRYIERTFSAMIGMTPKRYARVIRFKHAYHELVTGNVPTDAVHLDGYYDRSHFNKEFKSFIGATPTARMTAALSQATSISDVLLESELASA
jgi:AraC-like DNA-binding protein